ncbi:Calx-beta domain-containing protein [Deefgea sp. CFH1-16]|uniref:Calx-beta domain-containing protein n=1 Tax=Deefgea sp. CFH1-16 TaxID=2675457 RepID=UPI0015F634FD|nr:Calx-beta domain-containing protein [Deefgea sp. CFH1-16]MBM5574499.1 hypothetical protein [Deefgea sp. CFH1-16]
MSEGSAADFTVKLSNPSATDTQVTLNLITTGTNGNASATDVAGLQYKDSNGSWVNVPANGQVTIAAGQTEVIVRVPTVQDGVYEGKENFTLNATVNGNTVSGQGSIIDDGTGTIPPEQPGTPDNDQPKVASVSSPSVTEGGNLVFDVQLDHSSTTATTVNLNLANGSGIVGTDTNSFKVSFDNGVTYVNVTGGQVSVPAGTTSIKVQVATVNDNIVEGNETITLTAKSEFEPAAGAGQTGTGTILDNDSSTLSVTPALNNVSVSEGSAADFTVKLSNPSATDTQVTLKLITDGATGNASAADVAGLQYKDSTGNWVNVPANGQVTIAAGSNRSHRPCTDRARWGV